MRARRPRPLGLQVTIPGAIVAAVLLTAAVTMLAALLVARGALHAKVLEVAQEAARGAVHLADLLLRVAALGDDPAGAFEVALAGSRRGDPPGRAVQEAHAQPLLEPRYLAADRRYRQAEDPGGGAQGRGGWLDTRHWPRLWADYYRAGPPPDGLLQKEPQDTGWQPDAGHQPDLAFVPYVLTGRRAFLDELQAQASWCVMRQWPAARGEAGARGPGEGMNVLRVAEPRTGAWSLRQLDEALQICKLMWTEDRASFAGRHYRVVDAWCNPKPVQQPYPPIMIGGGGEKVLLRIVAQHADRWNFGGSVADFKRKVAILDDHCRAIGRNPAAALGDQFFDLSTSAFSLIHGIMSRSWAPTCSIGWSALRRR